jgi:hypothetical protein
MELDTKRPRSRLWRGCRARLMWGPLYFSTPDCLATWVAMASISGGDRQS